TDAIMRLCPFDKLTACQQKYADKSIDDDGVYDDLANIVQGIMLNIDNAMLKQCRNIVNERVIEICGTGTECGAFEDDQYMGTESLITHINNDGDHVIEGLISFGNVKISKTESKDDDIKFGMYEVDIQDYQSHLNETDPVAIRVVSTLQSTANKINQKIAILTQDPEIQMCVNGRDLRQIQGREAGKSEARFPNLLDTSIMAIISAGLDQANKNYDKKYNEIVGKAMEQYDDAVKATLCASMAAAGPKCKKYKASVAGRAVCREYETNPIDNIFKDKDSETGLVRPGENESVYSTKYTIPGVKVSELASVQQSGHGEFVQTDGNGNMIGTITMSATYSASNDSCTITTYANLCKELEQVYDTEYESCSKSVGLLDIGGSGCTNSGGISIIGGGGSNTTSKSTYRGSVCGEFLEPTVTTNTIKM
ncbi:MAG: hypothetical protein IJN91_01375, partial [Alphaproteobacteria bacterium]|nr:hypothetical protein [Alphaproteobacteria bacterium]